MKTIRKPHVVPRRRAEGRGAALAGEAYEHLKHAILDGAHAGGDWLSVVDLASELDCSRVPVMEALKRLQREGLVEIVPQVGCRVAAPDPSDVADFFALFASVEGTVTRFAAARRSKADLAEFRVVCAYVDEHTRRAGGPDAHDPTYRRVNRAFHSQIHAMAHSPFAAELAASCWDRCDFYITQAFGSLYFSSGVRRAHAKIRKAIVAGDAGRAEAAVREHILAAGARVSAALSAGSQRSHRSA